MIWLLWVAIAIAAAPTAYLLGMLALAAVARQPGKNATTPLRFLVVVPAHDEELMIGATLASLEGVDYPRDALEIVVVADNCSDRTAEIARRAGATVLERDDPTAVGKPAALSWTAEQIHGREDFDAVAVVDADCEVSPNLLSALAERLEAGFGAAQARYVVGNPGAAWLTGLRSIAFTLDNHIKPMARHRLGLSCGLFGTGMAFRRELIRRLPWHAFLLTEDYEYHLQLVEAGERVGYAPRARIASPMPTSLRGSRSQHSRWEGGRWQLVRAYVPRMMRNGVRHRDGELIAAAVERLTPPLTVLVPATAGVAALALVAGNDGQLTAAVALLAGQVVYVLGGMLVGRAPARVWLALLAAPALVAWKCVLLVDQAVRGRPRDWLRTARSKGGT